MLISVVLVGSIRIHFLSLFMLIKKKDIKGIITLWSCYIACEELSVHHFFEMEM